MVKIATSTDQLKNYLDSSQMAKELNIHPESVRRLIKKGRIKGAFVFSGVYLVHKRDFRKFKSGYDPRPGRPPKR